MTVGSELSIGEVLSKSNRNLEWLRDNYDELKQKYDKQWIIIDNQSVIHSASSYSEIMKAMQTENKNTAIVKFMTSEPVAMFF